MTREVILVGVVCLLCIAWMAQKKQPQERRAPVAAAKARVARALRPRTPEDCPECQEASQAAEEGNTVRPVVRPWSEVKSRRGRKKAIDTAGHACWNRACVYYGITGAKVHALTGYGRHGRSDRIQDLWVLSDLRQVDMLCQYPLATAKHTIPIIAMRHFAAAMFHGWARGGQPALQPWNPIVIQVKLNDLPML